MGNHCTPRDIGHLAHQLASGASAVSQRAAVNRAYYAAYHALIGVAELVPGNDQSGPQGSMAHRELPRRLRNWRFLPTTLTRLKPLANQARQAASQLSAAIDVRELADYSLGEGVDQGMVEMQLYRMEELLTFADTVRAELDRLTPKGTIEDESSVA
jgi:hypothetical protein